MKTVKQQTEVSFKLLDFADKVVMLPIINAIANTLATQDERCEITIHSCGRIGIENRIKYESLKKIFKVFSDLGCRTSLGESYEDIVKSDNSQEKQEEHKKQEEQPERYILQLFDTGQNRLETIKIIKEQLNLPLEEAKKVIDSCPIAINLRNHRIKQPCYEHLFYALRKIGCTCSLITKEQ